MVIKGPRNPTLAVSFKVCPFSSQSHSCYKTDEREFSNCGCHPVRRSMAGLFLLPPLSRSCPPQSFQSIFSQVSLLPSGILLQSQVLTQHTHKERLFLGNLPPSHSCGLLLLHPPLLPLLSRFISYWLSTHNLSLALLCQKSKGFQRKGDKVGSEVGWVGNRSFRKGARNDLPHSIPYFPP